jgi:hypothetical protein
LQNALQNATPDGRTGSWKPRPTPRPTPIDRALRVLAVEEAAGVLGIDPATLWRRRKKYGRLVDGGS